MTAQQGTQHVAGLVSGRGPTAEVTMSVGYTAQYGAVKVHCEVKLQCDQTGPKLEQAGRMAYEAARDMAREAYELETKP